MNSIGIRLTQRWLNLKDFMDKVVKLRSNVNDRGFLAVTLTRYPTIILHLILTTEVTTKTPGEGEHVEFTDQHVQCARVTLQKVLLGVLTAESRKSSRLECHLKI